MTKTDKPLTVMDLKVALKAIENKLVDIENRLVRMDIRTDRRLTKLETGHDKIDVRFDELEQKSDTLILVTHETNETVKGIWDKIDIAKEEAEKEIKRIKKHIGLVSN